MTPVRIAAILLTAATLACSFDGPNPVPTNTAPPASSLATETVGLATLPPIQVTFTPIASPTTAPYVPFSVATWADNVVLRVNPGYLFAKLGILQKGTALKVVGRSPGGEWLLVQTPDSRSGWVFKQLVSTEGKDMASVPLVTPSDVLVLRGHVSGANGMPVSGIQFALTQGSGSNAPRNDAMTDETGTFYAFMPPSSSGTWWLSYTAISCESNIMDAQCNWVGKPSPEGIYIELPKATDSVIQFTWQ